tara:strand:+ start:2714 stop:3205 length:492 start_codon:yes stop_codon:yes gene_type:complete
MVNCFLSLGSNMGDRINNINNAIKLIDKSSKNSILLKSEIYKSKAMYNTKLEDFYNIVIKIKTELSPSDLLNFFKDIEQKMGRINSIHRYSNRPIDIDILSYGNKVINSKDLTIPHPRIEERKFVLKPWSDIDSSYILASSNKKILDLLDETSDNSILSIIKQ